MLSAGGRCGLVISALSILVSRREVLHFANHGAGEASPRESTQFTMSSTCNSGPPFTMRIGRAHRLLSKEGLETHLLEMMIVRERFVDLALAHYFERMAIDGAPLLVGVLTI